MAAGVQARNAGCLFQQRAACLRLRLDQLADTPLPDHRRRASAGRLIGEEQLHVAGAGFLAVDAVDRAGLALDAARHLQLVGVVERRRRGVVGIVEEKRDFGGVACRPRARAGEDHVVHAGRAHVLVRAFAHHPAQRFDKVGLAAAVRPDDAGQAALDDEFAGFDEGLEAEEAEAVEPHAPALAIGARKRSVRRLPGDWSYLMPSMIADICSIDRAPLYFLPLMKKVGVESTSNSSEPRFCTDMISSRSFWSVKQASKLSCVKPASFDS